MKELHTLTTFQEVKALADPLRMRIVEAFSVRPMTTKHVAAELGQSPTKLYHHVDILERAGLIRLVETRQNRGTTEKYYRAIASQYVVDRRLLEITSGAYAGAGEYETLFIAAFEGALAEARQTVAAHLIKPVGEGRNALMFRKHVSGSEEEMRSLMKRVRGWISKGQQTESRGGTQQYAVVIAMYPIQKPAGTRAAGKREGKRPAKPQQR